MKNLAKIINRTKKAVGLGLAGAILCGGCATMTPAQKTALLGESLSILGSLNTPGSNTKNGKIVSDMMTISGGVITNQALMQHDLEVANAGRDQIVINNQRDYQEERKEEEYVYVNNSENSNVTPVGLFMYKNYVDFNGNGVVNRDELVGLNEPVYNLSNFDYLYFSFYGGGNAIFDMQNLDFKIYDMENGETTSSFNQNYPGGNKIATFTTQGAFFPKSGRYKAVLNMNNGKSTSLDFNVIK